MTSPTLLKDPIEALQEKDALAPCPACGSTSLGIDPAHPLITFRVERHGLGDSPKLEMLTIICKNCGRLSLHDPYVLGVLERV